MNFLDSRFHGNDRKGRFLTFYERIKLDQIEKHIAEHDEQITAIFEAMRQLMIPPDTPKKKIGFEVKEPKTPYGKRAVA